MIVKKLDAAHYATIASGWKTIVYFTNTQTNISGSIQVENVSASPISASSYPLYFKTNAVYSNADFDIQITGTSTFKVQSKFDYLNITGYKVFTNANVEITPGSQFSFTISNVTVPDVAPLPQDLPIENRTLIDNSSKIKFCNSPVFIRHLISGLETSIKVSLFIWDGAQNKTLSIANSTLKKEKVSQSDNYISIEISDLIRPYIKPNFAYNRANVPAITNQGVFFQAVIETNLGVKTFTPTYFATLGYKWNYEQGKSSDKNIIVPYGASGFSDTVTKWYNPKIPNYFDQEFDFTKLVAYATSSNIIKYNAVTPTKFRCTQDPSLIIFINKIGLWESFTPHGKFTATTQTKRTDANVSHRDPSQVDNTYTHSRVTNSLEVKQSYLINTGSLDENMTSIVEQLIYSPKIYLIKFKGDLELVTTVGITIDNTYVTIDNTNITIDSQGIKEEYVGNYKSFQQIPVIIVDEDFTRKTRINDKISIDYNIKFDETNNKINQIR